MDQDATKSFLSLALILVPKVPEEVCPRKFRSYRSSPRYEFEYRTTWTFTESSVPVGTRSVRAGTVRTNYKGLKIRFFLLTF